MADSPNENPENYPTLGRLLNWVDRPGNDRKLFFALCLACIVAFALEWTYEHHGHFDAEDIKGFYALYGFIMFSALIFVATCLRFIIKRRENYYAPKSIDMEDYPEDQLERLDHDV